MRYVGGRRLAGIERSRFGDGQGLVEGANLGGLQVPGSLNVSVHTGGQYVRSDYVE